MLCISDVTYKFQQLEFIKYLFLLLFVNVHDNMYQHVTGSQMTTLRSYCFPSKRCGNYTEVNILALSAHLPTERSHKT